MDSNEKFQYGNEIYLIYYGNDIFEYGCYYFFSINLVFFGGFIYVFILCNIFNKCFNKIQNVL